jgi:hypothetical protein
MQTIPTTGPHGLDFTFCKDIDLGAVVYDLFNLRLADFRGVSENHAKEQKYNTGRTHRSRIFVYQDGRLSSNKETTKIAIKGKAFDEKLVDLDSLKEFITTNSCNVSGFHLYADDPGDNLKFDRLWKQLDKHYFSSDFTLHTFPGNTAGDPRSIYFGSRKECRLCIYEKGKMPDNDLDLEHIRLEMQLAGPKAHAAFMELCSGTDIGVLARGLIAGMVTFKDLKDTDKNPSRRSIDPAWNRYLGNVEKIKLITPPGRPDTKLQLAAFSRTINRVLDEHPPDVIAALVVQALAEYKGGYYPYLADAQRSIDKYLEWQSITDNVVVDGLEF